MALDLSTASIVEKNKTASDGVYLLLVDIDYGGEEVLHLAANNENVTHDGKMYYAYAFNVDAVKQNSSELQTVQLSVSNVTGAVQSIIEKYDGGGDAKVRLFVVNTNVPDEVLDEENFVVNSTSASADYVVFKLGANFSFTRRFPAKRIMKDFCPFQFKGIECGYKGVVTSCNKTLADCRRCGNSKRFGGEPTIPQGGLYARTD